MTATMELMEQMEGNNTCTRESERELPVKQHEKEKEPQEQGKEQGQANASEF